MDSLLPAVLDVYKRQIDVMELQKVIEASANASGPGAGLATVLTIFSGGGLQRCV